MTSPALPPVCARLVDESFRSDWGGRVYDFGLLAIPRLSAMDHRRQTERVDVMYTSQPASWHLSLRGTACAICGQPAARLTVFADVRVIRHEQDIWPPCQLTNPSRSAIPEFDVQAQPQQAA
jgi:hypothetical protein